MASLHHNLARLTIVGILVVGTVCFSAATDEQRETVVFPAATNQNMERNEAAVSLDESNDVDRNEAAVSLAKTDGVERTEAAVSLSQPDSVNHNEVMVSRTETDDVEHYQKKDLIDALWVAVHGCTKNVTRAGKKCVCDHPCDYHGHQSKWCYTNMNDDDPDKRPDSQYCCHGECKPYIKHGYELWEGLTGLVELEFYWKCWAGGKAFAKWVDCDPVKNTLNPTSGQIPSKWDSLLDLGRK